jgi:hypothetical protein
LHSGAGSDAERADLEQLVETCELNGHSKKPDAADYRVALSRDIVRDRQRFGVVGNIIDGTPDRGRCTIRPLRR